MELQKLQNSIYEIRGTKVILDFDLSALYQIPTKVLKQAVRRNWDRFPEDFMFELNKQELEILRSQIVTSSNHGGIRYAPFAFTEQGVAMLSSVLNSQFAIQVNIAIMRTFVLIRQYALSHKDLSEKLMEHEGKFAEIYEALNHLLNKDKLEQDQQNRKRMGYL